MSEINTLFAGLAFLLSIVSLYLHWRKPKLEITYKDKSPYKKRLMVSSEPKPYPLEVFIRVKVKNKRARIAEHCFGKIIEWFTNNKRVEDFDPIKLHWVSNKIDDYSPINLSKDEFEYLDILLTNRNQSKILIYSNTHPRGTPLQFNDKDEHILKLSIYCKNGTSISKWYKVKHNNEDNSQDLTWISMNEISYKKIIKSYLTILLNLNVGFGGF